MGRQLLLFLVEIDKTLFYAGTHARRCHTPGWGSDSALYCCLANARTEEDTQVEFPQPPRPLLLYMYQSVYRVTEQLSCFEMYIYFSFLPSINST